MKRVFIEVRFKKTNEVKSFEAQAVSTYAALQECFTLLDKYNLYNDEYEILYILKA